MSGMGLSNTWVRDVSVVLPTFTAAIDDVTMAFAEHLKVESFHLAAGVLSASHQHVRCRLIG